MAETITKASKNIVSGSIMDQKPRTAIKDHEETYTALHFI
jgi:hypothetical protein